jgi:colicin import membrane protein
LVSFDITATTQANCVLKTVAPGAPKVHTLKGHKYQCVNRAVDPASNDLTDKPKPKDSATPAGVISKKLEKAKEIANDKSAEDAKKKAKAEREAKAKADREAKAEAERRRKAAEAANELAKKLKLLKVKKSGGVLSKETSAVIQSGAVRVR